VAEDWGTLPPPSSTRTCAVRDARSPAGIAGRDGTALTVSWSTDTLPSLWIWCENRSDTGLPDGVEIDCVGIEPSNTLVGAGLAASRQAGEGALLPPGQRWESWVELNVGATPAS